MDCWGRKVDCVVVVGFSKRKLAAAIEAYDRGNKKTVTSSKSTTSSRYCKLRDGSVYSRKPLRTGFLAPCQKNEKTITKAEYDRLKNKKKDAVSKTEPDTAPSSDDPLEAKLEKIRNLFSSSMYGGKDFYTSLYDISVQRDSTF